MPVKQVYNVLGVLSKWTVFSIKVMFQSGTSLIFQHKKNSSELLNQKLHVQSNLSTLVLKPTNSKHSPLDTTIPMSPGKRKKGQYSHYTQKFYMQTFELFNCRLYNPHGPLLWLHVVTAMHLGGCSLTVWHWSAEKNTNWPDWRTAL